MTIDLAAAATAALHKPVVRASLTARTGIDYDPYLPGRLVEHVIGMAELHGGTLAQWTAIVKETRAPALRAARRELAAYRDGVAAATRAPGLRAPNLLAWAESHEHVELWLEEIRDVHGGIWPVERFGVAARHIATWDARSSLVPLPSGFDAEDAWAERHGQPERVDEALAELRALAEAPSAGEVAGALSDEGFDRTGRLVASTIARIEALAAYPQTPLHHDLVRSNLFAIDDSTTVAIDWENVGRGPLGVDLAPLVIGSVRRGEASSDDLAAIESEVLAGYLDGLSDAGMAADQQVREAYGLAVGLRWHVVLGTIRLSLDAGSAGFRGSRRDESRMEAMRHLQAVSRHILEVASGNQP